MATLSKHGIEIGRIEYLTAVISVREDGKILRNQGNGWKLWHKCLAEKTPEGVFEYRKAQMADCEARCPLYADYKRLLHSEFGLSERFMAHEVFNLLAGDPDGAWSELNDILHISVDIDTVVELCNLHDCAMSELREWKQSRKQASQTAEPVNA